VLEADGDYQETAKGITCGYCIKQRNKRGENSQPDGVSAHDENSSQARKTGRAPRASGEDGEVKISTEDKSHNTQTTEALNEIDASMIYSESFYRSNSYFRTSNSYVMEDRAPSSSTIENWLSKDLHPDKGNSSYDTQSDAQSDSHSDPHSDAQSDTQSDAQSDAHSDALSDSLSDAQSDSSVDNRGSGNIPQGSTNKSNSDPFSDDASTFSSEFYRRSYYYRKALSLDSVDPQEPSKVINNLDRTPNPSPTTSGLRVKRLSKYGKIQFRSEPPADGNSSPYEHGPKQFSDTFYKRPYNPSNVNNKKLDFEYRDKDAPSPSENGQNYFPAHDSNNISAQNSTDNNTLYKLIDDQAFLSATLLDTSDDMKPRSRTTTSATRKPPPSMSIRVVVPMPSSIKKSDPSAPTISPSPPLSLPSSPSPPLSNATLQTPPSSPQLPKKPQQHVANTNSPYLQVPPVLTTPLSRSASPPLSLPAVPHKVCIQDLQSIPNINEGHCK
jgi:hypothetical protein